MTLENLRHTKHHWFRCITCRRDQVVEPTATAPRCCDRFMAPVNAERN